MNRPGSESIASMRRHWVMNTSSCPVLFCASPIVEGHHLHHILPASRDLHPVLADHTVAVMISQPRAATCGIQFMSSAFGFVVGRAFAAECGRQIGRAH